MSEMKEILTPAVSEKMKKDLDNAGKIKPGTVYSSRVENVRKAFEVTMQELSNIEKSLNQRSNVN